MSTGRQSPNPPTRILARGGAGTRVHRFPFAYDDPGLLEGRPIYTPTPGDFLLDAWVEVDIPFDGVTPLLDFGNFIGVGLGWYAAAGGSHQVDVGPSGYDIDSLVDGNTGTGIHFNLGGTPVNEGSTLLSQNVNLSVPTQRLVPARFTEANPLKIVVSSTGTAPNPGYKDSTNPLDLPLTIEAGINDEFIFDGLTYTLQAGTYLTAASVAAAMNAATHAGDPLSAIAIVVLGTPPNFDEALFFQTWATGTAQNGKVLEAGANDALEALGFVDGDELANGTDDGGDPGSTQGAGALYLHIATPS